MLYGNFTDFGDIWQSSKQAGLHSLAESYKSPALVIFGKTLKVVRRLAFAKTIWIQYQ